MKKKLNKTILDKTRVFPVVLTEEPAGGYVVNNPAFEGCYSQGETIEEALANIQEATELCIEELSVKGNKPSVKNISLHLIHA